MLKKIWEILWTVARALVGRVQRTNYADSLFLPRGQGPGILILGGITMLAVSLFLSLRIPRKGPSSHGSGLSSDDLGERGKGSARFTIVHDDASPPEAVQLAMGAARREEMGEAWHVKAYPDRHGIAFERCPGEAFSRSEGPRCEKVRRRLEEDVRTATRGRVVTVSCNRLKPRPCVFEILAEEGEA